MTEELGRAISNMLDMNALLKTVVGVMEKRLGFDRGLIMLADADTHALRYAGGYGHVPELEPLLKNLSFSLDKAGAKGVFVRAMHEHKPFLIPDIGDIQESLSPRSIAFARAVGCQSLICVPIIYEKQALGILAVDNSNSRRRLQQSDVSYLMGAASQLAVSIINARAFEKLGISEKKYRELVETANSIILRVDTTGRITFFNTFAREFFGFDAHDPKESFADGIITTDGSSGNGLRELVEALKKKPEHPVFSENKTLLKTGNEAWIAWTYKPIFDDKGNFLEILCIGNDISDFKKADQERTELQLQLQRAQKLEAIGTLAGGVAHDLNNILSGVVSYPDLLLMDLPDDSPMRKPILTIQKSGERAAAIVQDLLTLARRGVESSTVLNLNEIVSDCLKSPEISRLAVSHPGVTINSRLDPALMNVLGSPGHLAKAVTNLVSNALESIPGAGCITLTTENRHLDRYTTVYDDTVRGDFAVLEVSDTGIGLSEQDRERIFEPFYTKKAMGRSGTGLGMAVVWGIVKDHRGYIDISGRTDGGTVISLYFPLTDGAVRDTDGPDTLEDLRGKGERILVVDDVREQREIATEMLKMLGYTVNSVPSGEAAVEIVTQTQVDLLVLDMIMEPGIDGLETYRRILEFRPGQKAIIASGYSESERVQELKRLGAGAYIRKPYRIEVIGRAVRAELDR